MNKAKLLKDVEPYKAGRIVYVDYDKPTPHASWFIVGTLERIGVQDFVILDPRTLPDRVLEMVEGEAVELTEAIQAATVLVEWVEENGKPKKAKPLRPIERNALVELRKACESLCNVVGK